MTIDPNVIAVSKCGKYVYPVDSVTGAKTFAPIEYFKKTVENKYGGNVQRFVKEYVTRETKKYLKEGWKPEQLREIVATKGKLPKLDKKPKKDPNAPKKERRKRLASHANTTETVINPDGTKEVVRTYPWSNDPVHYFKSEPATFSIAEVTKDTCLRPDLYLDEECYGCKYYDQCTCKLKNLKLKR
jgi:hypothetical protein